jgi:hypothetical protein
LIRGALVGLAIVCVSPWAHAEEVSGTANAATPSPGPAPSPNADGVDRFKAPNGQLGAGLNSSPDLPIRVFLEMGFGRAADSESEGGVDAEVHLNSLSWIVGGGYRVTPNIEIVAMLPIGWANYGFSVSGDNVPAGLDLSQSESGIGVGNLQLGANYVSFGTPLRFFAGGAVQFGPWYNDYDTGASYGVELMHATRGGQDIGLYLPETVSIVTPARVEYEREKFVVSGDAALGLHLPTNGRDVDFSFQIAPAAGYYVTPTAQVGLRLPFAWIPTQGGSSSTFFAMEPYGRFDFDNLFLAARLTLNIDEPYGFAFDAQRFWGIHVGFGGTY